MKKFIIPCCLLLICLLTANCFAPQVTAFAEEMIKVYQIYDENNQILTERQAVEIGDKFIDKNLNEYEIYLLDETSRTAKAHYNKTYPRPKITKKSNLLPISSSSKKIALYMTHNDESYIIGDGTESVYGAGGIHDIAKELKSDLQKKGISVTLDETLHIPHNSSAYSRSAQTAKRLLNDKPDAIFDIHRDGASRQYYVTNINGKEHSKIRIVLGQSNPNSEQNLKFATYLLSVADVECPWLFHDIYWGKGHYNQSLSNTALLFEMGTHTIEKDYVLDSAKELANVINKTLYSTTVDEENNSLTIGGNEAANPTVSEELNSQNSTTSNTNWLIVLIPTIIAIGAIVFTLIITSKNKKTKQ